MRLARSRGMRPAPKAVLALALATAAGFVDAFGYAAFGHLLVAHMSGNTAVAAADLAQGRFARALARLSLLVAFAIGVALGAIIAHVLARRGAPRRLATVLGFEIVPLCAFLAVALLAPAASALASTLLAVAMGVQNAAARRVAGQSIRTTFVTGMIVSAIDQAVSLFLDRDPEHGRSLGLHAAIWLSFFFGAFVGAAAALRFAALALLAPIAILSAIAIVDLIRPLTVVE